MSRAKTPETPGTDPPDDRWVGRAIRFRHDASDSDDERDALFVGWPDDTKESRR